MPCPVFLQFSSRTDANRVSQRRTLPKIAGPERKRRVWSRPWLRLRRHGPIGRSANLHRFGTATMPYRGPYGPRPWPAQGSRSPKSSPDHEAQSGGIRPAPRHAPPARPVRRAAGRWARCLLSAQAARHVPVRPNRAACPMPLPVAGPRLRAFRRGDRSDRFRRKQPASRPPPVVGGGRVRWRNWRRG